MLGASLACGRQVELLGLIGAELQLHCGMRVPRGLTAPRGNRERASRALQRDAHGGGTVELFVEEEDRRKLDGAKFERGVAVHVADNGARHLDVAGARQQRYGADAMVLQKAELELAEPLLPHDL